MLLVHMPCSLNGNWVSKGENMTSCVYLDTEVEIHAKLKQSVLMIDAGPFYRKGVKLMNIQYSNYVKYEFLTKLG